MCPCTVSKDQLDNHICICLLPTLDQPLEKGGNFIFLLLFANVVFWCTPCVYFNRMREFQFHPNNICTRLAHCWALCMLYIIYLVKQLCAVIIIIPATGQETVAEGDSITG